MRWVRRLRWLRWLMLGGDRRLLGPGVIDSTLVIQGGSQDQGRKTNSLVFSRARQKD